MKVGEDALHGGVVDDAQPRRFGVAGLDSLASLASLAFFLAERRFRDPPRVPASDVQQQRVVAVNVALAAADFVHELVEAPGRVQLGKRRVGVERSQDGSLVQRVGHDLGHHEPGDLTTHDVAQPVIVVRRVDVDAKLVRAGSNRARIQERARVEPLLIFLVGVSFHEQTQQRLATRTGRQVLIRLSRGGDAECEVGG